MSGDLSSTWATVPDNAVASPGRAYRDALRLLFILVRGGAPLPPGEATADHDRVFVSEKRAQAIDFWVRYPDYLANELLDLHEREEDTEALAAARRIFDEGEPDVRLVKMVRWRRGAYEDLETSLAILNYYGLVTPMRRELGASGLRYEFLTGPRAREFLDTAVADQPGLAWYERQVDLALRIAGAKSGSALKDIHYETDEYGLTPYGGVIPPIKDRVLARLNAIPEA